MGEIALHGFAEMLRLKWGLRRVELVLEDQALRFRSKAAVDALLTGRVESTPPSLVPGGLSPEVRRPSGGPPGAGPPWPATLEARS